MTKKLVTYRGHSMTVDWPARIRAAQRQPTLKRDGVSYARIPYGQEAYWSEPDMEWHSTCGDCGVISGEFHVECCDMEACPICLHGQWLLCMHGSCPTHDFDDTESDIAALPETTEDVYEPKPVIPAQPLLL